MHPAPQPKRNVVISGLTAAGKTTHAKRLAAELGYSYVSGTGTLARLLGIEVEQDPPRWTAIADQIARKRTDDTDRELESELLRRARTADRQVFDVWALPWTSDDPELIRVWIHSSLRTRTWKSFISQGDKPERSLGKCRRAVREKDDFNQQLFLRTLGFDLYGTRAVFNVQLDNSSVISAPTREASRIGIERFAPVVRSAFDVVHGLSNLSALVEHDRTLCAGRAVVSVRPVPTALGTEHSGLHAVRNASIRARNRDAS